jgi:uncharacterized RDD family membrane protein YckC
MNIADDYIRSVIHCLPPAGPMRARIEMELRVIVAEQLEQGRNQDDVFRQLGDPKTLAASYLSSAPLVPAPLGRRMGAKLADIMFIGIAIVPALVMAGRALQPEVAALVVVAGLVGVAVGFGAGTIGMECWLGQTPGKRLFGLQVVRESGAAISLGQSIVRQIPILLQIYWIDVLFAFFTPKQQRAFELLSKTRVVMVAPPSDPSRREGSRPDHA